MPSKKKKYNARFPAGRIKKIMQTDDEVGKVAQAVPVIISRTLELFVESLLVKSMEITQARSAKTLTPSHMKQCILSESRFDFLKDLVKNIPDPSAQEDNENNARDEFALSSSSATSTSISGPTRCSRLSPSQLLQHQQEREYSAGASTSSLSQPSSSLQNYNRTPVIQFVPKVAVAASACHPDTTSTSVITSGTADRVNSDAFLQQQPLQVEKARFYLPVPPPLVPIQQQPLPQHQGSAQNGGDSATSSTVITIASNNSGGGDCNLYIDEDYDN